MVLLACADYMFCQEEGKKKIRLISRSAIHFLQWYKICKRWKINIFCSKLWLHLIESIFHLMFQFSHTIEHNSFHHSLFATLYCFYMNLCICILFLHEPVNLCLCMAVWQILWYWNRSKSREKRYAVKLYENGGHLPGIMTASFNHSIISPNPPGMIWALQTSGEIFCFSPETRKPHMVQSPDAVFFDYISATTNAMWALSTRNEIYVRLDISDRCPGGTKWKRLDMNQFGE